MIKSIALRVVAPFVSTTKFVADAAAYLVECATAINANVQRRRIDDAIRAIKIQAGDTVVVGVNVSEMTASQQRQLIESTNATVRRHRGSAEFIVIPLVPGSTFGLLDPIDGVATLRPKSDVKPC